MGYIAKLLDAWLLVIFCFLLEPNIHKGPEYEQISTLYRYTVSKEAYISLLLNSGNEISMVGFQVTV